jgi:hypothetical protein
MTDDKDVVFDPDGWEVAPQGSDQIKLIFPSDNDGTVTVLVPRAAIPPLVARLVAEIGPGQGAAISPSLLQPGRILQVQGLAARRHPDGSADLAIWTHLDDPPREVTIPLALSPENVAELLTMLGTTC